jgi:hypothetical protein
MSRSTQVLWEMLSKEMCATLLCDFQEMRPSCPRHEIAIYLWAYTYGFLVIKDLQLMPCDGLLWLFDLIGDAQWCASFARWVLMTNLPGHIESCDSCVEQRVENKLDCLMITVGEGDSSKSG